MPFSPGILIVCALTLLLSAAGTLGMIVWAHRRNLIDTPNHRSSHSRPTPRGGGVALVGAFYLGLLGLRWIDTIETSTLLLLVTGLPLAIVGYIDDARSLSARTRLIVQIVCATTLLALLPALPPLAIFGYVLPQAATFVLYLLGLVWLTNLYNFMDGIDGIAAGHLIAVCIAWAAILPSTAIALPLVLAVAALGFLKFNFPPARIFMGDVGSAFCGFVLGAMTLIHSHQSQTTPALWLIPLAPFVCDASITLVMRILRGERPSQAHRMHAYQRLARATGQHLLVSAGYFVITLLPLGLASFWAAQHPADRAGPTWLGCTIILCIAALALGAGKPDLHVALQTHE